MTAYEAQFNFLSKLKVLILQISGIVASLIKKGEWSKKLLLKNLPELMIGFGYRQTFFEEYGTLLNMAFQVIS